MEHTGSLFLNSWLEQETAHARNKQKLTEPILLCVISYLR